MKSKDLIIRELEKQADILEKRLNQEWISRGVATDLSGAVNALRGCSARLRYVPVDEELPKCPWCHHREPHGREVDSRVYCRLCDCTHSDAEIAQQLALESGF